MSRKMSVLVLPVLFLLALALMVPASANAQGVALKLFGGYDYLNGGDVNDGLKGAVDLYKAIIPMGGYTASGDYKSFHNAWDVGGDLIIYLTPVVGIGLGAGYIQTLGSASDVSFAKPATPTLTMSLDPKVTAIPLRASLYVSIPMGSAVHLSLHAGAAYYFAKMQFVWRLAQSSDWEQMQFKTDGNGFGFHGGLGLEINLASNLALVLEGTGRIANIGGFSGTGIFTSSGGSSITTTGKLYYYKYNYGMLGILPEIDIRDTVPSGVPYSDVREAKLDLSGFAARAGLVIRF